MKRNEKLIDFFEGNLSEPERVQLLEEIGANQKLKNEFEEYKRLYELVLKTRNLKSDQLYLDSILIQFRSKSEKSSFLLKPVFATGMLIIFAAISFLLYNTFIKNNNEMNELENFYEYSSFEINNFEDFEHLLNKEEIDELLYTELMGRDNSDNSLVKYLHLDDNYHFISEKDAEEIYQELLTKKIL